MARPGTNTDSPSRFLETAQLAAALAGFLDLGAEAENREFTKRLLAVTNTLSGQTFDLPHFRLFRGQQRALGELMMQPTGDGHHGQSGHQHSRWIGVPGLHGQHGDHHP